MAWTVKMLPFPLPHYHCWHAPQTRTSEVPASCSHNVCVFRHLVQFSEQTAIIFHNSIKWLLCEM